MAPRRVAGNGARWAIALGLGLRQSEALALRWSDSDLDAGALTVNRTLHRVTGQGIVFAEPKSERSRRRIALPHPLVDLLRSHRTAQFAERLRAGDRWEDGDLVFAQPNGRPLDKHSDWEVWRVLLADAGVRVVRLHDARHSAATTLLALGVPSVWSPTCSATRRHESRRPRTSTSCPRSAGMRPTRWGRRCGTRRHTNWHTADHGRKVRAGHRGWS